LLAVMVTFGPRQVLPAIAADQTWKYGGIGYSLSYIQQLPQEQRYIYIVQTPT
jgi:hypothetical protein